jgi:hypothetical protein
VRIKLRKGETKMEEGKGEGLSLTWKISSRSDPLRYEDFSGGSGGMGFELRASHLKNRSCIA